MGHILTLKDGTTHTVFSVEEFMQLVKFKMGDEAYGYLKEHVACDYKPNCQTWREREAIRFLEKYIQETLEGLLKEGQEYVKRTEI